MVLWRISNYADLSGLGAEFAGGRWHTAGEGKRIVYLAEHPAVALIENLANLRGDPKFFQQHFQLLKVSSADTMIVQELSPMPHEAVPSNGVAATQAIGDDWLASGSSPLLRVPSIPSPESWNYLLNPLHPEASKLRVEWARRITYDQRLFQLREDVRA